MANYVDLLMKGNSSENKPINQRLKANKNDKLFHWALGKEYFDGNRKQGYGGYYYDGRWKKVVDNIFNNYSLKKNARILDLGCAKGFLLHDIKIMYPQSEVWGLDISPYALNHASKYENLNLVMGNMSSLPFEDKQFDFVFCNNSLHNILNVNDTIESLREIQRVSKSAWISVAAYKNKKEKDRIDKWAVVATTYLSITDWLRMFQIANYSKDYFWFKP